MASGTVSLEHPAGAKGVPALQLRKRDHRFYTAMAFAIAVGVFGGFSRTYFLKSYFHAPVIPLWVHVHGAVFTGWMLLYLMQNLLAMNGGMKLHRRMGLLGLVLSCGVVILGILVAVRQARLGRSFPFPDVYSSVAVSVGQMILFGVLVGLALLWRRDGETHKRLMLMAPQLFFFPAFGRLLSGVNAGVMLLALGFYVAGPIYDRATRGQVHKAYKWGVPLLILTMPPFAIVASHAGIWRGFVDWMMRA